MRKFFKDISGASGIEYAIIAALISTVILVSLMLISDHISNTYSQVGSSVDGAYKKSVE